MKIPLTFWKNKKDKNQDNIKCCQSKADLSRKKAMCIGMADEENLLNGKAKLSFFRQRCIRGNIRKFRIYLDDNEVYRLGIEEKWETSCEPGFHRLYVKMDTLVSPVLNIMAEAEKQYCFNIACTMENGMFIRRVEDRKIET